MDWHYYPTHSTVHRRYKVQYCQVDSQGMWTIKVITICRNFQIVIDNSITKSNTHSASRTDLQGSKLNCYIAFLRFYFGENGQKVAVVRVNPFKFWYLLWWLGLFYLEICEGVFWHNSPFFLRVIRWHFSPFKGELLKIFTFLRSYFGENGLKITLVRMNPFKFWSLLQWLGLFYLEICEGVFLTQFNL